MTSQTVETAMRAMAEAAKAAAKVLAHAATREKMAAAEAIGAAIARHQGAILEANAQDLASAGADGIGGAFLDRLRLSPERIAAMLEGLRVVSRLPDPVGRVLAAFDRPNGLKIERIAVPIGVIGVIFESRPNVAVDAGVLCLMAGNAVILRGGSEGLRSTLALGRAMAEGLHRAGLPQAAIQIVATADRAAVGAMLSGLGGALDLIVPRGGKSLVSRVQDEARVPVLAHLEGVNHVYVHAAADVAMAKAVLLDSKMRRVGVCGAAETLLLDRAILQSHGPALLDALIERGCEVRGDSDICKIEPRAIAATGDDWPAEYLDAIIAARVVDGVDEAMAHIARYGSAHTDAIVTADEGIARRFLGAVDSAIVLWNASTQFADGAEFGFGAEIGIATGRLHARGPVGLEQLTTYKYLVLGNGQTRG